MVPVRQSLDHCVKCTICESACPVSAVTALFPGPKYEGPQAERFRDGTRSPDSSVDYCSGCGICTQVCPQGVKVMELNSRARAELKAERGVPVRDRIIARPGLMGRLGAPAAPVANRALGDARVRSVLERTLGVHRDAPMPRFARRPFRTWARRRRAGGAQATSPSRTVAYFHGCSTDWFEPGLGRMAVAVLEHSGIAVRIPRQGCCGLPLQSNGLFDDARRHARRVAAALAPEVRAGYAVVATSTSCGLMLKREAREVLGVEDDELRLVGEATYDICELLLDLHAEGALATDFRPLDLAVTYYAPCQQRGHGIGKPALDLFALVPGLRVHEVDAACCGVAGTYGVKREKYAISMAVGEELFEDIRAAAPDLVACDGETCRWQITKAVGVPSVHPVEVLYRAYGLGSR